VVNSRIIIAAILLIFSLTASLEVSAAPVTVNSLRMWPAPDNTRLVFDVSGQVQYKLFILENPHRVVIDISNARLLRSLPNLKLDKSILSKVRTAPRKDGVLRVVLDLKTRVKPKSFTLRPYQDYGNRLVVDLYDAEKRDKPTIIKQVPKVSRDIVVAIDAGHGGEDGGARGHRGTKEKVVVLQIAKKLKALVNKQPGMRAVMIRNGDYYLPLRKRMQKARKNKADLFISIHADAFNDRRANGSSVYVLSQRGASSEAARFLAASENEADLIGGVSLDDKDDMLASVLLDLSQTASIEASLKAGSNVLGNLKYVGKVHKRRVQQAGFVVLKSPDIPSLLVETAFISNPNEERKLKTSKYQRQLANAMMKGIRQYFYQYPPPGSRLAMDRHIINSGETLSIPSTMLAPANCVKPTSSRAMCSG